VGETVKKAVEQMGETSKQHHLGKIQLEERHCEFVEKTV
jgi:hypothetical protein